MMNNITFITSLQIESEDRLRNAIAVFSYLSKNFPESKIYIKEVDSESKFLKIITLHIFLKKMMVASISQKH